jgi:hypothetical protein
MQANRLGWFLLFLFSVGVFELPAQQSEAVHRGYTHHEIETLRQAVLKLPSLG